MNLSVKALWVTVIILTVLSFSKFSYGDWQDQWNAALQGAKKEGKLVVGIPASSELRTSLEPAFKSRFPGIEIELISGRGSATESRVASEYKAGVRHIDLVVTGAPSPLRPMVHAGIADAVEPYMILPEVKDPANWWGGHLWVDNAKKFVYAFQAYQTDNIWYNADLIKPEELASYESFLQPNLKGRIGFLDPRNPGAGQSVWVLLWSLKGEEYLKKLAAQDLFLSRDQRQIADALAKGRLHLTIGITYYTLAPYLNAGLAMKVLPAFKEGIYVTNGSGSIAIVKNPPHPSATRVFTNWILSKEGQEIYGKAMGQGTRRLDVETKWLTEFGARAAKDFLKPDEFYRVQDFLEDKVLKERPRAVDFAETILR